MQDEARIGGAPVRGVSDTSPEAERFLIEGEGIGHMAVQLAKRMGSRVFAVASGDDGVALCKGPGADAVVDGRTGEMLAAARALAPEGIHAALFTAGGEVADRAAQAMREGGRIAYPSSVHPKPKVPEGVRSSIHNGEPDRDLIDRLNRLIERGPFDGHVAQTFPVDQAAEAHRALGRHYLGKLASRIG